MHDGADQLVVLEHRHRQNGARPGDFDRSRQAADRARDRLARPEVGNVDELSCVCSERLRGRSGLRHDNRSRVAEASAVPAARRASRPMRKPRPRSSNRLPNFASQMRVAFSSMALNTGCKLARRAGDDLQHLGGRGLLLQRFGEIVGALAQLVEQPRVLDGDDGLGGEVLHQLDLLVGERAHLLAVDDDGADQFVVLEHRHGDHDFARRQFDRGFAELSR